MSFFIAEILWLYGRFLFSSGGLPLKRINQKPQWKKGALLRKHTAQTVERYSRAAVLKPLTLVLSDPTQPPALCSDSTQNWKLPVLFLKDISTSLVFEQGKLKTQKGLLRSGLKTLRTKQGRWIKINSLTVPCKNELYTNIDI